jgi:hypothetical protein
VLESLTAPPVREPEPDPAPRAYDIPVDEP